MTTLVKSRRNLPSFTSSFFNTGRLFPDVFDFDTDLFDFNGGSLLVPNANIVENEKAYTIELAAPGLERKDFKIEMDNNMLTVSAEKKEETKENHKNYRRREFSYNSFTRSFTLPDNSTPDKIEAKYDNGILRIFLPKKEITISKPVKEIKVS